MEVENVTTLSGGANFDPGEHIVTPEFLRIYEANQKLREMMEDLHNYQIGNPKNENAVRRAEIDHEREVELQIQIKKKHIKAQIAILRTLYKLGVKKIREEKHLTTESRNVNEALILQLHNLQYEEQSLKSEISAAQNYDHNYTKLPLIPVEEFLEAYPEHKHTSEQELMTARIEHEYQGRVKLEERRQEKLKQKQQLIAEVKKRKDELTRIDEMLEKFVEAAEPIGKALAIE